MSDGLVILRNIQGSKFPGLLSDFRCGSQSRSLCTYMYMSVSVCVYMYTSVCASMCIYVQGGPLVCCSSGALHLFCRGSVLLGPGVHQLAQAAWSGTLCLPSSGIASMHWGQAREVALQVKVLAKEA